MILEEEFHFGFPVGVGVLAPFLVNLFRKFEKYDDASDCGLAGVETTGESDTLLLPVAVNEGDETPINPDSPDEDLGLFLAIDLAFVIPTSPAVKGDDGPSGLRSNSLGFGNPLTVLDRGEMMLKPKIDESPVSSCSSINISVLPSPTEDK